MTNFLLLSNVLLTANFFVLTCFAFNLDIDVPVFKIGRPNSYFGYAVAGHFKRDKENPMILVGAPKDESGQVGTERAGAMYACPINRHSNGQDGRWCEYIKAEFDVDSMDDYNRRNEQTNSPDKYIYFNAKKDQLLGSVISGGGTTTSSVLVCAPNLIFDVHAYMDGQCYLLNNELAQFKLIRTCQSWAKAKRHNEWGSCQDGFSAALREDMDLLITGIPGAKRWAGGANVQEIKQFLLQRFTTKAKGDRAVEDYIPAHSYLGYSVGIGYFGFSHEEKGLNGTFTAVAGGPRYNETGAVFFLPLAKTRSPNDLDELLLLSDHFKLSGDDNFASSFGYSLLVLDIDGNGFDDLIVGAPHYFDSNPSTSHGGAVFVYFSIGKKQRANSNDAVFEKPYRLFGPKFSQFGSAITGVDLNADGFKDIVVGAPYDAKGGAVYVYLGSKHADFDVKPSQIIHAQDLKYNPMNVPLTTFGWSLYGGADLDNSNYPDVVVGAFNSSAVVLLRAKPVINFDASIDESIMHPIDKDNQRCRLSSAKACFKVKTILTPQWTEGVDWNRNFICRLEVLPSERQIISFRAQFDDGRVEREWNCLFGSSRQPLRHDHELFIPESNRDWLNPIKMKFSVRMDGRAPSKPTEKGPLVSLKDYPVIAKKGSEKEFKVEFDNKCGSDRKCEADLNIQCSFVNLIKEKETNVYVKDVGEDDNIDIVYTLKNNGERAYETNFYVEYDENLIELPQILEGETSVKENKREGGFIEYIVANPMLDSATTTFKLRYSLSRGKDGLKTSTKPLHFATYVNTTSTDIDDSNNNCSMDVRVVVRAELDLQGKSLPDHRQLLYGGKVVGESAMNYFDDIGPEVIHEYVLTNYGPWSVSNATILVDFPYEVNSTYEHGKWALYITNPPQVRIIRPSPSSEPPVTLDCEIAYKHEYVNPLNLKPLIEVNNGYITSAENKFVNNVADDWLTATTTTSQHNHPVGGDTTTFELNRRKRRSRSQAESVPYDSSLYEESEKRKLVYGRKSRELRIKPVETEFGEKKVTIDCGGEPERRTAKCVRIKCHVYNLVNGGTATVTVTSRLWNSTFVEDYRDVNRVEIISRAKIEVDKRLGIQENDTRNNEAEAKTEASPDLPAIPEKAEVPLWIIILAVFGGIFVLLCIIILLWKCGFFNRNRHTDQPLYKAEYKHNEEFDT